VLNASNSGLLAKKRVLAFATHGLVPGDLPFVNQPALAMASIGTEQTDPTAALLTLDDVLSLKLNADWVVLSACNTRRRRRPRRGGVERLGRGILLSDSLQRVLLRCSVSPAKMTGRSHVMLY